MIQGYPDQPSIFPGSTINLHVSTTQPYFRVEFYRQGATLIHMPHPQSNTWQRGQHVPQKRADSVWNWPAYDYKIPEEWPTGAYIAMLFEADEAMQQVSAPDITTADGRDSKLLFVVRNPRPGDSTRILYKLALFTYQAYNAEGDPAGSLYPPGLIPFQKVYKRVTLQRPGGGTGGSPYDTKYADYYDPSSPRQTFAHWDALFIAWLERNGYVVDYCTDLDVHTNADNLLDHYALLLCAGHDEYWSEPLRTNIETAIQHGLNMAFFSGNCFRRVTVANLDELNITIGDRIKWCKVKQEGRPCPENCIVGGSYRNAGGRWDGEREAVGYTVQYADHWIYEGTSLSNGNTFGREQHLVGYECDGMRVGYSQGLVVPTGIDGVPPNFIILGFGRLSRKSSPTAPSWNKYPESEAAGDYNAAMGFYTNTGCVFTAATTDWARVVAAGDPMAEQITRNVINRLQTRAVRIDLVQEPSDVIEGEPATFRVCTETLPTDEPLHYQWTASAGRAALLDQPSLDLTMPSPPQPVTITVTVTANDQIVGFGSYTIMPHSAARLERWKHQSIRLLNKVSSKLRTVDQILMQSTDD